MRIRDIYPPVLVPWLLLLVAGYSTLSYYLVHCFSESNNVSLVWPLSGAALALTLLGGRKYLSVVLVSEFIGNVISDLSVPLSLCLAISVAIETFSCHWLLTGRLNFDDRLMHTQDFVALAKAAAMSACLGGSTATASFMLFGSVDQSGLLITFLHWWQGDVLGIILVTPLILVWRNWPQNWRGGRLIAEFTVLLVCAFLVGQIIYLDWMRDIFAHQARLFWSFLFVVLAAVGFGRHGVLVIIVLTALQALTGLVKGVGVFAGDIDGANLQSIWCFLVILTIVGVALAINVEERIRREAELEISQQHLKRLMQRREQIREDERRHVAREVHDELGQILTAIKMEASLLKRNSPTDTAWHDDITHLIEMIGTALKVVRNITQNLRPSVLELGMVPAMHWLVDQFSATSQIECGLSITGNADGITEPYVITLFRVVQESLTNIARHANADKVAVTLAISNGEISLSIVDNGRGFDSEAEIKAAKGIGLSGMKERIESLGGNFAIVSATGQGCAIHCQLPLTVREEN